jgi:hypothetical protein
MRWLMVSQDTPRDVLGGTELYVRRLSDALLQRGAEISWAYYSEGEPGLAEDGADGDGIAYYKISGRNQSRTREQAWQIDPLGLHEFRKVLELARPDCVHFNGFGRNQSPEHFAAAKQAGATVLMTYHSPGQSCSRWDLLYKGRDVCSGLIDIERCTDCALHRIGVPGPMRAVQGLTYRSLRRYCLIAFSIRLCVGKVYKTIGVAGRKEWLNLTRSCGMQAG